MDDSGEKKPYPFEQEDRAFLHDMATPLTILRLHAKRLIEALEEGFEDHGPEVQLKLLNQMLESIEKIELLHSNQKARIYLRSNR